MRKIHKFSFRFKSVEEGGQVIILEGFFSNGVLGTLAYIKFIVFLNAADFFLYECLKKVMAVVL